MTNEQIAALRAAANNLAADIGGEQVVKATREEVIYLHALPPHHLIELLDHIAKLEAERDAVRRDALEEARQACAAVMIKEGKTSTGLGAYVCTRAVAALMESAPASAKEA